MKKGLLILILTLLSVNSAESKKWEIENLRFQIGLFANFNSNFHSAGIAELPGVPNCCNQFNSGSGSGMAYGLHISFPFAANIALNFRALYSDMGGLLEEKEYEQIIINRELRLAEINHSIDAEMAMAALESSINFRLFGRFSVFAGPSLGYFLRHDYSQSEKLVKPDEGTFENGLRIRNERSGEIPEAKPLIFYICAGMFYDIPLDDDATWLISPEVTFTSGLSSVLENQDWTISNLRFGLALKFAPFSYEFDTPIKPVEEEF